MVVNFLVHKVLKYFSTRSWIPQLIVPPASDC